MLTHGPQISLLSTIPWDSYLVRKHIWTYPPDVVLGYTLYSIPLEEVFFFVIQTYNTSMLYVTLTRRLVLPAYLQDPAQGQKIAGVLVLSSAVLAGIAAICAGGQSTYIGLIVAWGCPFLLIQW